MKRILLSSLLLVSTFGFNQEPVIEWQKSLGGTGTDEAQAIQQTTDGSYIVAGKASNDGDVTGNNGGWDFWIVKLDISGNIIWQKSFGGSGGDEARSIQQTTDGGYIVAGQSSSNDGDVTGNNGGVLDSWVLKLDATGNITWQKTLGGTGFDRAHSVQQTTDGGYIVAGESDSNDGDVTGNNGGRDCWVIKLDASGNISWQKSLGGSGTDYAHSIEQTADGGYIIAGQSASNDGDVTGNNGSWDCWIIKLDASGNISWQKSLGGNEWDHANSIRQTTDEGYIVAGLSNSSDGDVTDNNGYWDYWIVKLDVLGNITWQKSLGGSGEDYAYSIQQTVDGDYIVAGESSSSDGDVTVNNGDKDYWVVKLDTAGNITWQKSLGGTGDDEAHSVEPTVDGGYIIAGYSLSNDGDVTGNRGMGDYWIVKLSPETSSIRESETLKFNIYPNPSTKTFTISSDKVLNSAFKMIDLQCREVLTGKMNGKEQTIDISKLSKGAYSVVFEDSVLPVLSVIKE